MKSALRVLLKSEKGLVAAELVAAVPTLRSQIAP